jgi:threonine dehydratase
MGDEAASTLLHDVLTSRVYDVARETPLDVAPRLSRRLFAEVLLKREDLQPVFSFKLRGAHNRIAQLGEKERTRGVIAASAGNHAQGVAFSARHLGLRAVIVMPVTTPEIKVEAVRAMGAEVVLSGDSYSEAQARCDALAAETGLAFVHPFDDLLVIAGQGTIGEEILRQSHGRLDAVFVPVGGGGLIAGIGTVMKARAPQVSVIGVEPEAAASLTAALAAKTPTTVTLAPTLADGLAVSRVGDIPFASDVRVVDRVVTVDEAAIALAILRLIELEKSVVEGAGATPLAAFLAGKLPELAGRKVVLTLCGGNIDTNMLGRVIDVGLVADGRLARFTVSVLDRPGGLARLTATIAQAGASIHELTHDRAFSGPKVSEVRVVCVVETTGPEHVRELHAALAAAGFDVGA